MNEEFKKKKRKTFVVIGIILAVILLFVGGIILSYQAVKSMGIGSTQVADYDTRIEIWDTVAGNNSRSKLDDMNINYKKTNTLFASIGFADAIVSSDYSDVEQTIDTFTYLYEIKGGYEKETYEDEPYLIPYLVDGSDAAVIVIPGGGFGYKSMDGSNGEGKDVALALNEAGINAFVLHYRSNPYEYPISYLDLQRAVRYLKYHKDEYHLDENKITMIGFSAGGNMVGMYINEIMGTDLLPDDYIKDEIDSVDDSIDIAAMLYPAVSFNDNVPMLFSMFNADEVRDETKRNELLNQMDLIKNFDSSNIKQFIAYGSKDNMVGTKEISRYIEKAKELKTDIKVIIAENQSHGFDQKYYMDDYIKWLKENL